MADTKITALTAITTVDPAADVLPIVDVSDTSMAASGTTKKITSNQILGAGGTATLASATITGDLTVDTSTLKVDSANNRVGIGTASPGCNLEVYSSSANELRVSTITAGDVRLGMSVIGTTYNWIDSLRSGGAMVFGVGNAEHYRITSGGTFTWSDGGGGTRMTLNATGLGVGASPSYQLHVSKSQSSATTLFVDNQQNNAAASSDLLLSAYGGEWKLSVPHSATFVNPLIFKFGSTEMMRLTAGGELLVGTTTNTDAYRTNIQFSGTSVNGLIVKNLASTGGPVLLYLHDSAQTVNTATVSAEYTDSTTQRWRLYKNGGLANYQANNVNLSDVRTKTDIKPLGSYWNKIKSLEVVTFKYKDQTHSDDNIGLIAQQVESVAPELVDADGFGNTPEDGVPLKTIYTTDLYHAAIKGLQEAMIRIEALEAKLA